MRKLGYDRIWDCGSLKYVMNISQNPSTTDDLSLSDI